MKPRLRTILPLTAEDRKIMALCAACTSSRENEFCWCSRYYAGDRRDADLMLGWMRGRVHGLGGDLYVRTFPWVLAGVAQ
jgi:hypothetical protein